MASNKVSLIERIRSIQYRLSRRVLHRWIRPTILGCDKEALELAPQDLVCYVMPYQSIADLMVLDQACQDVGLPRPLDAILCDKSPALGTERRELERRAFFFLGHPEGAFGRKTQRQQSQRMQRLFEHQLNQEQTIKVVPVSMFWGHQPDREQSIFKSILSENWTVTSRFKKLLAAIFHPSHIVVQFSKPISIASLISKASEPEKHRRKLLRLLRRHFTNQKQAILGPDLSHRRTLINSIMTGESVMNAIKDETAEKTLTRIQVEKKANQYANEIVSHQSYRVIRMFHVLLTWVWNKLYDGIDVSQIEVAKEWAKSHEIIYVPCHRSHIDYLLMSYVLYNNGLTPPHIAAGKNLNLPLVGPLLRRSGAFFMRRSFQGDPLYKAIFDEYLHLMFVRGYSVEYFIEGGRSRTGRTLLPRTGMLSMTLRSFIRDASKPIAFMPVYFGYERILEANTYLGELSGQSKTSESIFDIFGIFKTFKKEFGKVAVNFGEPLDLASFLDQHLPDWQSGSSQDLQFTQACQKLGGLLAERINNAATINPVNLVATAILSTPRQAIERRRLEKQIGVLSELASIQNTTPANSTANLSVQAIIEQAVKVIGIACQQQSLGDVLYAGPKESILLTYYRNNIIHRFVLPSLVARLIRIRGEVTSAELLDVCNRLLPYIKSELFLHWTEADLPSLLTDILERLAALQLIHLDGSLASAPGSRSDEFAALNDLGEIIEPMLERFHIVMALLMGNENYSMKSLEKDAAAIAQQLSAIYGLNSPEFFDQTLLARFITSLNQMLCISTDDNTIRRNKNFEQLSELIDPLLDSDVRYNVAHAVTQSLQLVE